MAAYILVLVLYLQNIDKTSFIFIKCTICMEFSFGLFLNADF